MINLYKNGKLEFNLNGSIENNKFLSENIIYDFKKRILVRNEDDYRLTLDFINCKCLIKLINYNQELSLPIEIVEIIEDDKQLNIKYKMESEKDILNELEVIF